jgi:bifunctional oligoribonuclease and PAP phosphatase NrnA
MQEIKSLFEQSSKILISSHISPDADAVCSALLLGRTLKQNYPDSKVAIVLEEKPGVNLNFLEEYELVEFMSLRDKVEAYEPDLFIIVDANNFKRVSRKDFDVINAKLREQGTKVAIIDHHEPGDKDDSDVYINNKRPATAEEVYNLCYDTLGLKKPHNYAETALLGIISDTQRHRFDHPGYRETYRIVSELLDDGASIEKLELKLEHHSLGELEVIAELAMNIKDSGQGYTYSLIGDEFSARYYAAQKDPQGIKDACDGFVNSYIRSFESNRWGFIIYPEMIDGKKMYSVTLRAASDAKDVSEVARQLGGGGHKPAAGAKLDCESIQDALRLVQETIKILSSLS